MKRFSLIALTLMPGLTFAEGESVLKDPIVLFCLSTMALVLVVVAAALSMLNTFIRVANKGQEKSPAFKSIWSRLTGAVPVEAEETIMTEHVYDGIRELDNDLPLWWKYMFYATIVFSFIYIGYYHYSDSGVLQDEEYKQEIAQAEKEKEEYQKKNASNIDENNVKLATDATTIDKGKAIYAQYCAACHGKEGGGGVGPNLTDEYWLHGGGINNVFKTVKNGVPQKGMIAWKAQLTPSNIREVASYIISLKGSNPANGKEPQGDKYEEKEVIATK